jgi:polysaccharide export outer membrane protein
MDKTSEYVFFRIDGESDMTARVFLISLTVLAVGIFILSGVSSAQTDAKPKDSKPVTKLDPNAVKPIPLPAPTVQAVDGKNATAPTPTDDDEILPYYNNYLKEYRLGPSDVITVEVFGQCPDYCKANITIPPNAKISYPLVREGVMVAGRTVEQVAAEITKKLDEFIIDPKVTVTLDKAMNTRYSVMGNVAAPGVRVMDRKVSVYEAVLDAGGVTKNGDKSKVWVVSYTKDGHLAKKMVSLTQMENGKGEMVYLNPGDQVFVAGKGFTFEKFLQVLGQASAARVLFGSPL